MPVTTKAQRSAEGADSVGGVRHQICEIPSKKQKGAKVGNILG